MEENKNAAPVTPELLVWARKKAGLSIEDVASKIEPIREGYRVFIENWEQGQTKPTISQAQKLAEIYKVPFAAFFLPEPPKEPEPKTLREIINSVKERIEELNSNALLLREPVEALDEVRFELEQLEERIEGMSGNVKEMYPSSPNFRSGIVRACNEILGKK